MRSMIAAAVAVLALTGGAVAGPLFETYVNPDYGKNEAWTFVYKGTKIVAFFDDIHNNHSSVCLAWDDPATLGRAIVVCGKHQFVLQAPPIEADQAE